MMTLDSGSFLGYTVFGVKAGRNAWERRSKAPKFCNSALPSPIEGSFQRKRTFLGP